MLVGVLLGVLPEAVPRAAHARALAGGGRCPAEMVRVTSFCVDRYEASLVDAKTAERLSPYYPPQRRLLRSIYHAWERLRHRSGPLAARLMPLPEVPDWQRSGDFKPRAVSEAGVVPQAYISYHGAKAACETAGKRLCSALEWETACRGSQRTRHPYGEEYRQGRCNIYRSVHPAYVLHGASYYGHLDPRLNLVAIAGEGSVLGVTGAAVACASRWGDDAVYDMEGNLDEWVDDERGVFRGGFYARGSYKGCEASVESHGATYFSYSTGFRCCRGLQAWPVGPHSPNSLNGLTSTTAAVGKNLL